MLVAASVAAAVIPSACTEVGTDPNAVVALVFEELPYPAVVAGDTLRMESGATVPLQAIALNSEGDEIQNADVRFIALDQNVVEITSENLLVSIGDAGTTARIVAQAGALQSRPLTLVVTSLPDTAELAATVDTIRYSALPDAVNVSGNIAIRVMSTTDNEAEPTVNVRGWLVHYEVSYNGTPLPPTDNTTAWFVDASNRRSAVDTTENDGRAQRRLRIEPSALAPDADSLLVTATVTARGAAVAGTPISFFVHVRPQQN